MSKQEPEGAKQWDEDGSEAMRTEGDAARPQRSILVRGAMRKVFNRSMSELIATMGEVVGVRMLVAAIAVAAGRVTLLAAREKLGKSTLAAFIAAIVSRGAAKLGAAEERPLRVLWVGLEEALEDALLRFKRMGVNMDNIFLLERIEGGPEQLEAEIIDTDCDIVVLDSLARFTSGRVEDENNSVSWTRELGSVTDIARRTDAAIVILHHAAKSTGAYRGSTAIGANVDMIVEMFEDDKDSTVRHLFARGRFPAENWSLRFDVAKASFEAIDAPQTATTSEEARKLARCQKITAFLAANPGVGKVAIRGAVGGRAELVDEALESLVADGFVRHQGGRSGYILAAAAVSDEAQLAMSV